MHSDLVKAVVSRPFVTNVSSVDFEVNQKASMITRGTEVGREGLAASLKDHVLAQA